MTKSQQKAHKGHLEEGKNTNPAKDTRSGKPRKRQERAKKLKIKTQPQNSP
jgi:hypothetical protein